MQRTKTSVQQLGAKKLEFSRRIREQGKELLAGDGKQLIRGNNIFIKGNNHLRFDKNVNIQMEVTRSRQ